jgi:hypothetical protein
LARPRKITASSAGSIGGATPRSDGGTGRSVTCLRMTSAAVVPTNGTSPTTIWYRITATA